MHEYFVSETHESVGLAWAKGKCNNVRNGHKHDPHIDGTRACPGYPAQVLFSFDRTSPVVDPPVFNREMERIDEPDPLADIDDTIRRMF